jgi:hypothetical protein
MTMGMSKFSESAATLPSSVHEKPHSFISKVKKMQKNDGPDVDKSEWIKSEFLMDSDNPALGSKCYTLRGQSQFMIYCRLSL